MTLLQKAAKMLLRKAALLQKAAKMLLWKAALLQKAALLRKAALQVPEKLFNSYQNV